MQEEQNLTNERVKQIAEQKLPEMQQGQKVINERVKQVVEQLDELEALEREALELLIKRLKG
jgi:hypothetical protein